MRRMGTEPPVAERAAVARPTCSACRPPPGPRSTSTTASQQYAVDLVERHPRPRPATGSPTWPRYIACGVSSRATLGLVAAGRALALLRRRSYVLPQDVWDVAPDVLTPPPVVSYEALAQGVEAEHDRDPAAGHRAGAAPDAHPGRRRPAPCRPPRRRRRRRPPPRAAGMSVAAATPRAHRGPSPARRSPAEIAPPARADARSPHRRPPPRRPRRPRPRARQRGRARAARYVPGDDPRRIDWNVTARIAGAPRPRRHRRTRGETWLIVDLSPSTDFGTARCTKRDLVVACGGGDRPAGGPHGRPGRRPPAHPARASSPCPPGPGPPTLGRCSTRCAAATPAPTRRHPRLAPGPTSATRSTSPPAAPAAAARSSCVSDFPGTGRVGAGAAGGRRPARDAGHRGARPARARPARRGLLVVSDPETGRQREVRTDDGEPARSATPTPPASAERPPPPRCGPARSTTSCCAPTATAPSDLVGWLAHRPRRLAHLRRSHAAGAAPRAAVQVSEVPRRMAALPARRRRRHGRRLGGRGAASAAATSCASPTSSCSTSSRPSDPGWRRHVPAALFLAALACWSSGSPSRCASRAGAATTGPPWSSPSTRRCRWRPTTSRPTRLEVAQEAARAFVDDLPDELNVGLVTFNGVDHGRRAAHHVTASRADRTPSTRSSWARAPPSARPSSPSLDAVGRRRRAARTRSRRPARIVVMSDGETTTGRAERRGRRCGRRRRRPGRHDRLRHRGRRRSRPRTAAPSRCPSPPSRWPRSRRHRRHRLRGRLARRARRGLCGHRQRGRLRRGRPRRQRLVRRQRARPAGAGRGAEPALVATPTVTACSRSSPSRSRPSGW